MSETEVDLLTPDGAMNTVVIHPDEGGPFPVVLLLMDANGIRECLTDIARRIATVGYYVVMPNLFYRKARSVHIGPTRNHPDAEANLKKLQSYVGSLNNGLVASDVGAVLDFLLEQEQGKSGPVGVVGYCMSGAFAMTSAARYRDRIGCVASYYGTRLVTDREDSPHLVAKDISAEMYFAFAEHDHYVPLETVDKFKSILEAAGARHQIEVYPGTDHGFVFADRPTFNKAASEKHWERLFPLLLRTLG